MQLAAQQPAQQERTAAPTLTALRLSLGMLAPVAVLIPLVLAVLAVLAFAAAEEVAAAHRSMVVTPALVGRVEMDLHG